MTEIAAVAPSSMSQTRPQRTLKRIGWLAFGFAWLVFFTLVKLPDTRVRNFIQGTMDAQLAPYGITVTSKEGSFSAVFGISYTMKDVTISFPPPQEAVHLDELEVAPSLLTLLTGKIGGKIWVEQGDGALKASFATGLPNAKSQAFSLSFSSNKMNFGKLGILSALLGLKGSVVLTGDGSVSGDLAALNTASGHLDLDLSKIVIDEQNLKGFALPTMRISEGKLEAEIVSGKATVKTLKLGKPGSPDDITASATGDITLGRTFDSSTLNLRTHFGFSPNVMKSFSLLDALLGAGKQKDGSYAFNLTGPAYSPNTIPITE